MAGSVDVVTLDLPKGSYSVVYDKSKRLITAKKRRLFGFLRAKPKTDFYATVFCPEGIGYVTIARFEAMTLSAQGICTNLNISRLVDERMRTVGYTAQMSVPDSSGEETGEKRKDDGMQNKG